MCLFTRIVCVSICNVFIILTFWRNERKELDPLCMKKAKRQTEDLCGAVCLCTGIGCVSICNLFMISICLARGKREKGMFGSRASQSNWQTRNFSQSQNSAKKTGKKAKKIQAQMKLSLSCMSQFVARRKNELDHVLPPQSNAHEADMAIYSHQGREHARKERVRVFWERRQTNKRVMRLNLGIGSVWGGGEYRRVRTNKKED